MKTIKDWYLEFIPHPDEPKETYQDLGFSSWLERTDRKLIKRHLVRIKRPIKAH